MIRFTVPNDIKFIADIAKNYRYCKKMIDTQKLRGHL